jgi:hypothetical protein
MKPLQLAWFIFTAAVAAWVLSTCVTHAQVKGFMILPPIEYDHDYEGDLTIKMVDSVEELRVLCDNNTPQMLACSMNNARSCLIIMVKDEVMRQRGWTTGLLLRHERGHCNGWGADHAGERPVMADTTQWVSESARVRLPLDRLQKAMTFRGQR